jgi:DNA modification methylase
LRHNEYELTYKGKAAEDKVLTTRAKPLAVLKSSRAEAPWRNILITAENLHGLASLIGMKRRGLLNCADGAPGVRLVYIDPPFSTKGEFKAKQNQKAYKDKVIGAEFVEALRKRLILLREILTEDGSIYVHLDWKKAHYIKVIMDEVFGEENFLNDIVWRYGGRGAKHIAGQFSRNHDIILWYRKGASHVFNQLTIGKRIPKKGSGFKQDDMGRWFKTSPRGDYTDASMMALAKEGRVYTTRNGTKRVKYFLREDGEHLIEDKLVGDVWDDIPDAMHLSESEKTGYPTQKPEALLERIIRASSNPGDIVLDCFAGAGTTLAAAEKLGRRWVGMDSGTLSAHTIEKRLLTIAVSKSLDEPKKKYSKACRPFDILGTLEHDEAGCGCAEHGGAPSVKCRYDIDEESGECVVKIERFSSPGSGLKGMEALSSVAVDFCFDGEAMKIDLFATGEELEKEGYELRFPLKVVKGEVLLVFADIFGHEKWFVGELA